MQTSGQDPEIVLRYARLIESRQGLRPAAELIDIALEAHPGDVGLLVRRAQLALSLGDVDTARALRARLSTLEGSEDVVASLDMAITAQFGGAEDVITALEEAWTTSRDEAGLLSLGAAHLRSGNAARALELLDGALAERPDWNAARLMRADAHMAAGTFEAAEADLAAVATATPGDAVVQANLARLRLALGRAEAADAAIAEGLSHAPEDYELQVLQARRLETTGDVEAARAALERLAQRQPGDPRVAQRLGLLLTAPGRPPEDIRQALQVTAAFDAASDPALQEIRGWVLHRGGDDARAAAMLRDAATGRPDDPVVQARLGLAELGTGDVEQARAVLSRALDLAAQADAETDGGGSDVLAMARDALDGLSESARSTQSN